MLRTAKLKRDILETMSQIKHFKYVSTILICYYYVELSYICILFEPKRSIISEVMPFLDNHTLVTGFWKFLVTIQISHLADKMFTFIYTIDCF